MDANQLDDILKNDGRKALNAVNSMGTKLALDMIHTGEEKEDPEIVLRAMREHPYCLHGFEQKKQIHETALDVLWELSKQGSTATTFSACYLTISSYVQIPRY